MNSLLKRFQNQSGQALLLVLLSMAVILTVVLSILSRSILDVAVTTGEEEALRAFSAAEAGIERALIVGTDIGKTLIGDAEFRATVSGFASGLKEFVHPISIYSGESIVAWFVAHDDNRDFICSLEKPCFTGDTLKVCWGKDGTGASDATTPAIEVIIVYAETPGDYSTVKVARVAVDPNTGRGLPVNFEDTDPGGCTIGGQNLPFQKTIDLFSLGIPAATYSTQNGLQYARIKTFYNTSVAHPIGIDVNFAGNSVMPSQGLEIESSGSAGDANRKISVFQSYGEPPSVFDSAVFSTGGIVK